jgi:hypothetical protein
MMSQIKKTKNSGIGNNFTVGDCYQPKKSCRDDDESNRGHQNHQGHQDSLLRTNTPECMEINRQFRSLPAQATTPKIIHQS